MKIETIDIEKLTLDPSNARKHNPKNLEAIKGSLKKFGQQKPIVIDKNMIVVAGNGTIEAAKSIGWKKIDVVRTDLEGPEAIAFALADNRTSELAEWDTKNLSVTLASLAKIDFDLKGIGFDDKDLCAFIKQDPKLGLTDDDEIPEQVETRCKPGDLWMLGEHRLLCGDSTDVLQVERLMGGEKADMVFTDPPYGIDLNTNYAELSSEKSSFKRTTRNLKKIENDDKPFDAAFLLELFKCEVFLWGANYYTNTIPVNEGSWIVWDKRQTEELDKMYGSCFEMCWSRKKHKQDIARVTWAGCFGHSKKDDGDTKVHPTMKPVKLAEWFFERWGKDTKLVVDLFLGSGSTLIACEKTGRKCYGSEIDPHYCDVIIQRYINFVGSDKNVFLDEGNGKRTHISEVLNMQRQV